VRIDFIPPSQSYQSSTGYVFEVIKVDGEEDNGYDEDENTGFDVSIG
jgi:hypothetical protein